MKRNETEVMELQRRTGARTSRADLARHVRLILLLVVGRALAEVQARLRRQLHRDRWSKCFATDRLAGLFTQHASREHYKMTDHFEALMLGRTTKHKLVDGSTYWSTRELEAEFDGDISLIVARIWAKHGTKSHRLEGYLASSDPDSRPRRPT